MFFKNWRFALVSVALPILTIFLRQRDLGENPCNEALDACEWSSWMYTTSFLVLCASTASTFNRIVEYHWDFWVCHLSRHSQGDHWSGAFYVCRGGHGDHHKIWTFWRWRSCTKTLWIVILLNVHTFSVHDLWQLGILCKAGRKKTFWIRFFLEVRWIKLNWDDVKMWIILNQTPMKYLWTYWNKRF